MRVLGWTLALILGYFVVSLFRPSDARELSGVSQDDGCFESEYVVVYHNGQLFEARCEAKQVFCAGFTGRYYEVSDYKDGVEIYNSKYVYSYSEDDAIIENWYLDEDGYLHITYRDFDGNWWAYEYMTIDEAFTLLNELGSHDSVELLFDLLAYSY